MQAVLCTVSILFGSLSIIAAGSQIKREKKSAPALVMTLGSLLLIAAAVCNLAGQHFDYILALLGCTAICAAAIQNGIKSEQFHLPHHIIRIALSILLIIGFVFL